MNIDLCLMSHTNVGKTSLARTLLRRDIGRSLDRAHVTDTAEVHELVASGAGDALLLWDTPGLGDSARLLRRLSHSADPIGWLMTQVWDRWVDRPLYSSQLAIRAVREHCDVVLYLVNASEGPAGSGYVDMEMQILDWMRRPVLVLLNQVGPPRDEESERHEEDAWRVRLAGYPWIRKVLSLDAFTRVWMQEDELLAHVWACLPADSQPAMARLREAWQGRNIDVFEQSMASLARQLALHALDSERITARGWTLRVRGWMAGMPLLRTPAAPSRAVSDSMDALARRAGEAVRVSTQRLILLHGLNGQAAGEIEARLAGQFKLEESLDPAKAGLLGALLTGALGGLAADIASGGLTFGAGALVGGVLGLLGAGGAATAYNVARGGGEDRVGWSTEFLMERAESAVLRYLAVAHFGRGRGRWVDSEYPPRWPALVHGICAPYHERMVSACADARASDLQQGPPDVERCTATLQPVIRSLVTDVLSELYPRAAALLAGRRPADDAL